MSFEESTWWETNMQQNCIKADQLTISDCERLLCTTIHYVSMLSLHIDSTDSMTPDSFQSVYELSGHTHTLTHSLTLSAQDCWFRMYPSDLETHWNTIGHGGGGENSKYMALNIREMCPIHFKCQSTHHLTNRLHSREVLPPAHIAAIAYLRLISYTVIHTHT